MPNNIPDEITHEDIAQALRDLDAGVPHSFKPSTGYDVLFSGRRYPPKAVIGLAARRLAGRTLEPRDFKGGRDSKCFRILEGAGFDLVTKADEAPYPEEISEPVFEGAKTRVDVNRYERDPAARKACIDHYGAECQVCHFRFEETYGSLGEGFIHVHHRVPLSSIGHEYQVDPVQDLSPVCPNCHAMLHKRQPPYTIEEMKQIISDVAGQSSAD